MKKLVKKMLDSKMAIGTAGLAIIISMAIIKHPSKESNSSTEKNKITPPLKNVNIDYKNFSVDAKRGSTIKYYETGSVITIPDSAFVDMNGKIIIGKVDIKYREFHNPVDFFVSGIPMTYDSAGTQYQFESAGMLEILAFQHNKPVFVNPEKKIIVEMLSPQTEDKYNIYKYNSVSGNWKYAYKDRAYPTTNNDIPQDGKKQLPFAFKDITQKTGIHMEPELLIPKKSNAQKFHFDIQVDSSEFPEISTYKGVQFEVDKNEKEFNPIYTSSVWNDITLEKGKQNGSYLMTLSKDVESHTFETVPVFDGRSYDTALILYKKLYTQRKDKDTKQQKINDSIYALFNKERITENNFASAYSQNAAASMETQNLVQRIFVINGFGVWNSDCPASLPKGEQFAATYTDTLGKKLTFKTLYLVEKGRNAMFAITSYSRLYYDPSKKNILWAVTTDNKLAIFKETDFEKIKIKNDSCTVKMTVVNKPINKVYEVESILKI
jgi:hypothetical protein